MGPWWEENAASFKLEINCEQKLTASCPQAPSASATSGMQTSPMSIFDKYCKMGVSLKNCFCSLQFPALNPTHPHHYVEIGLSWHFSLNIATSISYTTVHMYVCSRKSVYFKGSCTVCRRVILAPLPLKGPSLEGPAVAENIKVQLNNEEWWICLHPLAARSTCM